MNLSELDFPKLIIIEAQFLCNKPTRDAQFYETPAPVEDKILATGLLYNGWSPSIQRFAAYGKRGLGNIVLSGLTCSIPVLNSCLDELVNEALAEEAREFERRLVLTVRGIELVKATFDKEVETLLLPSLHTGQ